jgi:non-homologous end joining protein Ku
MPKKKMAPVIDLMEALKKSMAQHEERAEERVEELPKKQPQRAAGGSRRKKAS